MATKIPLKIEHLAGGGRKPYRVVLPRTYELGRRFRYFRTLLDAIAWLDERDAIQAQPTWTEVSRNGH